MGESYNQRAKRNEENRKRRALGLPELDASDFAEAFGNALEAAADFGSSGNDCGSPDAGASCSND